MTGCVSYIWLEEFHIFKVETESMYTVGVSKEMTREMTNMRKLDLASIKADEKLKKKLVHRDHLNILHLSVVSQLDRRALKRIVSSAQRIFGTQQLPQENDYHLPGPYTSLSPPISTAAIRQTL